NNRCVRGRDQSAARFSRVTGPIRQSRVRPCAAARCRLRAKWRMPHAEGLRMEAAVRGGAE
ncbi:hypothetical protein chiPu_0030631, partial [Chiloscyllium punctatum]|nr:hypothetical protein [Chiloscyllium punctatum]